MTDSPDQITAAKKFAVALASNIKLLNAFIAAERKIVQIDPQFSTAALDNFLVSKGYDCTIAQVAQYGAPILSDTKYWAGTYYTQVADQNGSDWSQGPQLVISSSGAVQIDGVTEPSVTFSYLDMTFPGANLLFYMGTPGAHEGTSSGSDQSRVKACFGTYLNKKIVGLVDKPSGPKRPAQKASSFMTTLGLVGKYMGQINQAFMIYDLIKKATGAQEAGDESAVMDARGELSPKLSQLSESQGEVATTQQSAVETVMGENPGMTIDEAADALRALQADDLGVDMVADVADVQLDAAGEAIAEVPIEEGGLEIGATVGEEVVGDLAVDALLDDALLLVLL